MDELRSTLVERRRIRRRYHYTDAQVHELCRDLERVADMIAESPAVRVVERDPNDDMVIACAVEGRVDYVVTRDKDLLSLGLSGHPDGHAAAAARSAGAIERPIAPLRSRLPGPCRFGHPGGPQPVEFGRASG